jgi:hypothetical protein
MVKSTWIGSAVSFIKGEDGTWGDRQVPEHMGKKHINELLGRHLFHPYDPELSKNKDAKCFDLNEMFFQCMSSFDQRPEDLEPGEEPMALHLKHVNCYHPHKQELMKCLVKVKRQARADEAAAAAAASGGGGK